MKNNLKNLLENYKTKDERIAELLELCPELKEGNKIYYDKNLYIIYKDNNLYSGSDASKYECLINMAFPCIFYLSSMYIVKAMIDAYDTNEKMQNDKSLYKDANGFVCLKNYGVIGTESMMNELLIAYKSDEEIVDEALTFAATTIE